MQRQSCLEQKKLVLTVQISAQPLTANMEVKLKQQQQQNNLLKLSPELQLCFALTNKIQNHPFGYFFKEPINPYSLDLPNYLKQISKPMNIKTIKQKFKLYLYNLAEDYNKDMILMFNNALHYNRNQPILINNIQQLFSLYKNEYNKMLLAGRQTEQIVFANSDKEIVKRKKSWQKGNKQVQKDKLGKFCDLLNQLSVRKKRQVWQMFIKKYSQLKEVNGTFSLSNLNLEEGMYLLKLASELQVEELDLDKLLGIELKPIERINESDLHEQSSFEPEDDNL